MIIWWELDTSQNTVTQDYICVHIEIVLYARTITLFSYQCRLWKKVLKFDVVISFNALCNIGSHFYNARMALSLTIIMHIANCWFHLHSLVCLTFIKPRPSLMSCHWPFVTVSDCSPFYSRPAIVIRVHLFIDLCKVDDVVNIAESRYTQMRNAAHDIFSRSGYPLFIWSYINCFNWIWPSEAIEGHTSELPLAQIFPSDTIHLPEPMLNWLKLTIWPHGYKQIQLIKTRD